VVFGPKRWIVASWAIARRRQTWRWVAVPTAAAGKFLPYENFAGPATGFARGAERTEKACRTTSWDRKSRAKRTECGAAWWVDDADGNCVGGGPFGSMKGFRVHHPAVNP